MNEVLQTLLDHRSIHHYQSQPVPEEYVQQIVKAAQAAPSWIHGQQVSIVRVRNKEVRAELKVLTGNQPHVEQAPEFFVFCADFYRAYLAAQIEDAPFAIADNIDSLLVGATDVGLCMGNAIAAAESFGLGIVPIGGIRRRAKEVITYLQLPEYVLPIAGLCIGYAQEVPEPKPRLNTDIVFHEDKYKKPSQADLQQYNETMRKYAQKKRFPRNKTASWTNRVASFYSKNYYPETSKMYEQQGFTFHNEK